MAKRRRAALLEPPLGPTGRLVAYVPAGADRDELLGLVRIAVAFKAQQRGRRPGFLRTFIAGLVMRMKPPVTFEGLLDELDLEAARRNQDGADSPIERVSRSMQVLTYHDPRRGRLQIGFDSLRNLFTSGKKEAVALVSLNDESRSVSSVQADATGAATTSIKGDLICT